MEELPKLVEIIPDAFVPSLTVESTGYLYITVRINKSISISNVYWHLVDPMYSLIELGFEVTSCRLTSISIPLFKGTISQKNIMMPGYMSGEPLFDLAAMGFLRNVSGILPEVVKRNGRISLNQTEKDLDILITDSRIKKSVCCKDKVIYGFDHENHLSMIRLVNQAACLVRSDFSAVP